eukprot:COSAG06_NODE_6362_length_2965_cov_61.988137_4_plen_93_part_00
MRMDERTSPDLAAETIVSGHRGDSSVQEVEEEEDRMQLKHEREERAAEVERVLDRVHREAALKRQQQSGTEYRAIQDKTRQDKTRQSIQVSY